MTIRLPTPSDPDARLVLHRQVQVMFELADDVLADVTLEQCLRKPDERSWSVHQRDGRWFGELAEETDDLPVPSLAWTMWHPIWWLTVLLAHTSGHEPPAPEKIEWPGPATSLEATRALWGDWNEYLGRLDGVDLTRGELTRFPYTDGRPFIYIAGWASMELTKNLSEMCLLRRLV
jgi:hypothetical protein